MEQSNKRIIKNTSFLYIRMLVMMALSFLTTRIVLNKLGIDDYGLYNVVGGFVAMFTVLNNVLQSATRRFMSISIGEGNQEKINRTFSTSFVIHILIGIVVVFTLETIGLWLLNTQLNIQEGRETAANWVFQFSVISVFLAITQTPYTAAVTSHERFNIYAYMSIFDVIAKLGILFLLVFLPFDKLIVYAFLMCFVNLLSVVLYILYCNKNFAECCISFQIDKILFKQMLTFSGWDSLGNISAVINNHGLSILLNLFFGTAINASRGLAATVSSTISTFVSGFITAAEPQLAKFYAKGEMKHFESLIFNISQYTLFMLAIIAVPAMLELDFVLKLWLGEVPDYTSIFIKITVIATFIQYSNLMVLKGIVAIGRVKQITSMTTPMYFLHLPLVWGALKIGWNPTAVYWVGMIPSMLGFCMNLYILHKYIGFPSFKYFNNIFLKNIGLVGISCIFPFSLHSAFKEGLIRFLIVCCFSVISTLIIMWFFALNKEVRNMITSKVNSLLHKK